MGMCGSSKGEIYPSWKSLAVVLLTLVALLSGAALATAGVSGLASQYYVGQTVTVTVTERIGSGSDQLSTDPQFADCRIAYYPHKTSLQDSAVQIEIGPRARGETVNRQISFPVTQSMLGTGTFEARFFCTGGTGGTTSYHYWYGDWSTPKSWTGLDSSVCGTPTINVRDVDPYPIDPNWWSFWVDVTNRQCSGNIRPWYDIWIDGTHTNFMQYGNTIVPQETFSIIEWRSPDLAEGAHTVQVCLHSSWGGDCDSEQFTVGDAASLLTVDSWSLSPATPSLLPGESFTFRYTITNPNPDPVRVTLGATLKHEDGTALNDDPRDLDVDIASGTGTYQRNFVISDTAPAGRYNAAIGLHRAHLAGMIYFSGYTTDFPVTVSAPPPPPPIAPTIQSWQLVPPSPEVMLGESFTIRYSISNTNPDPLQVTLGATLKHEGGTVIYDSPNDIDVTVTSGTNWYSRNFVIDSSAPFGRYNIALGIHKAHLAGMYDFTGYTTGFPITVKEPLKPVLTRAYWSAGEVMEGQTVQMIIETANVIAGTQIEIALYEDDIFRDDAINTDVATATVGDDGRAVVDWVAQRVSDGWLDPEFFFEARLPSDPAVKVSSGDLIVRKDPSIAFNDLYSFFMSSEIDFIVPSSYSYSDSGIASLKDYLVERFGSFEVEPPPGRVCMEDVPTQLWKYKGLVYPCRHVRNDNLETPDEIEVFKDNGDPTCTSYSGISGANLVIFATGASSVLDCFGSEVDSSSIPLIEMYANPRNPDAKRAIILNAETFDSYHAAKLLIEAIEYKELHPSYGSEGFTVIDGTILGAGVLPYTGEAIDAAYVIKDCGTAFSSFADVAYLNPLTDSFSIKAALSHFPACGLSGLALIIPFWSAKLFKVGNTLVKLEGAEQLANRAWRDIHDRAYTFVERNPELTDEFYRSGKSAGKSSDEIYNDFLRNLDNLADEARLRDFKRYHPEPGDGSWSWTPEMEDGIRNMFKFRREFGIPFNIRNNQFIPLASKMFRDGGFARKVATFQSRYGFSAEELRTLVTEINLAPYFVEGRPRSLVAGVYSPRDRDLLINSLHFDTSDGDAALILNHVLLHELNHAANLGSLVRKGIDDAYAFGSQTILKGSRFEEYVAEAGPLRRLDGPDLATYIDYGYGDVINRNVVPDEIYDTIALHATVRDYMDVPTLPQAIRDNLLKKKTEIEGIVQAYLQSQGYDVNQAFAVFTQRSNKMRSSARAIEAEMANTDVSPAFQEVLDEFANKLDNDGALLPNPKEWKWGDDFLSGASPAVLPLMIRGTRQTSLSVGINNSLVQLKEDGVAVVEFYFDFSLGTLDFSQITVEKQPGSAARGYLRITGLELAGGATKTVYVDHISGDRVCIKDAETASIEEISSGCTGAGEISAACNSIAVGGYTCTLEGTRYKVTGLKHSAVIEYSEPAPAPPPASSSGSSGGGGGWSGSTSTFAAKPAEEKTSASPELENASATEVTEQPEESKITANILGDIAQLLNPWDGTAPARIAIFLSIAAVFSGIWIEVKSQKRR